MMTKEDCTKLSQLVGGLKRARAATLSIAAQVHSMSLKYAGTHTEMLNDAGIKCIFASRHWLENAIETLEMSIKESRKALEVK